MSDPVGKTPRARLWADRGAARIVGAGGLAVVVSLAGILAFLLYEVAPLAGGSEVTASGAFAIGSADPRALIADPYVTHLAVLGSEGSVRVRELAIGAQVAERELLGQPQLFAAVPEERLFAAARRSGEVAILEVGWRIDFEGRQRVVRPELGEPVSTRIDTGDARIEAFAVRAGPDRRTIAAALDDGLLAIARVEIETNDFTGETEESLEEFRLAGARGARHLLLDAEQRQLFGATREGLRIWSLSAEPRETQRIATSSPITAMALLVGGRALITGHADGSVAEYFRVPYGHARIEFTRIRRFAGLDSAVLGIAPSERDRSFLALGAGGEVGLYHGTSAERLWVGAQPIASPSALTLAPKGDVAFAVGPGQAAALEVHNPHPESALRSFFARVWYEDYREPAFVWQSTGGTDAFEPKLSLTPLLHGTLKGTLYALLMAVPLGILGAIYVSQFMHPGLQAVVKPTVEIMASLPSVVLGFVAGLWLAPRLEQLLPGIVAMLVTLPLLAVGAGAVWHALPRRWTHRVPQGGEIALQLAVLGIGSALCVQLSPLLEARLFDGSVSSWLYETTGLVYDQRNAIVAGIAMGFAVIPIILSLTEDSLSNVPPSLTAGSLALGASRWQTVARIVLPAASPGIFAAVMIGFGRAIGETMIVLMATGNTPILDWSAFNGFRTLSANIAVEIPEAPHGGTLYRTLFLSALLLFAITFSINTAAELVRERLRRRFAGE